MNFNLIYAIIIPMHIPYKYENPKPSISSKFWQFIRFTVVSGIIFTILFFTLNFQAYKQILVNVLNPEVQAKAQEILSQSTGDSEKEIDTKLLLPILPEKKDEKTKFLWPNLAISPTDNRIVIPKLAKSIPIIEMSSENIKGENWNQLEKQIQKGLELGIVHYPGTSAPDQFGNLFLTGHSSYYPWSPGKFKDVFATLHKLEPGDRYYVYYNQIKYTYEITEKKEVQPSNVDVLNQPRNEKISTLMTCTPVGTALRRLIIVAKQIS